MKLLISAGAKKESRDKYGNTPLFIAAKKDTSDLAKYLISVGANKNTLNYSGQTLINVASPNVKQYLISLGQ